VLKTTECLRITIDAIAEIGRRVSVVSTTSTTELDPELVEGNSGDFSFVLSFGGSKRKNIEGEYLLSCLIFLSKSSGVNLVITKPQIIS